MSYKYEELSAMSREQLESIATDLQIKAKKVEDEQLVYEILDAQAKEESLKPNTEKKKRGRPRKADPETAIQPTAAPDSAAEASSSTAASSEDTAESRDAGGEKKNPTRKGKTERAKRTAMFLMLQLQRRAPKFQGQESLLEHRRSRSPKSRLRALMPLLSTRIERKIPPRAREHA